jgi:hypothetical protein
MDGPREPLKPPDGDEQQTSPAQVRGATSGGSRRMLLIGLAVFLCIGAAGAVAALLSSPGDSRTGYIAGPGPSGGQSDQVPGTSSSPAAKPRSAHPTATKTRTAHPTPRASNRAITGADVTNKGVARSALRWPPRLQRQMLDWQAGSGGAALTTVETQMGNAMQAAGFKLYSPMRLACVSLASGISRAQIGPPIPYDVMQRLYARTLAGLSRAAADCHTAISVRRDGEDTETHVNGPLLNQARAEFAAMSPKLYTATAEIQALGR